HRSLTRVRGELLQGRFQIPGRGSADGIPHALETGHKPTERSGRGAQETRKQTQSRYSLGQPRTETDNRPGERRYRTHQRAESRGSQGGSPSKPGQHEHRSGQSPTKRETGPLKDRAVDPDSEQTTDKTAIELLTGFLAEEAELPLGRGVAERLVELFLDLGDGVAMRIDVALEVLSGLLTQTDALVQLEPSPSLGELEL